jgi:hypothetical protein
MGSRTKWIGLRSMAALGAWAGAAGAAEDDVMQQPLTRSEAQRGSMAAEGGEESVAPDAWARGEIASPLARRSKLGGAVGWNFNVPLGSVRDFAANVSPVGLEIQLRYWALPRVSFGLSGEWDSYADQRPRSTYQLEGGALTATAYNNLLSAILRFVPTYYLLEDGPVLPYVAPNIGVAWTEYRSRTADLELTDSSLSIAYGAEAGVLIPAPLDGPMFLLQARYTALPASEFRNRTDNAQTLAFMAGMAF